MPAGPTTSVTLPASGKVVGVVQDGTSGPLVERVAVGFRDADGAPLDASLANPLPTRGRAAGTATRTAPAASAVSVELIAANPARLGAKILNDSPAVLYIREGVGPASAVDFDEIVYPGGTYRSDAGFIGSINGIWSVAGSGQARIVEYT